MRPLNTFRLSFAGTCVFLSVFLFVSSFVSNALKHIARALSLYHNVSLFSDSCLGDFSSDRIAGARLADLASFNKSVSSSMSRLVFSTPSRSVGVDDLFSADRDKNDYDWLLTPPGTPPVPTLDPEFLSAGFSQSGTSSAQSLAVVKTPRLGNSKSVPSSRSEPFARVVRGNPDFQEVAKSVSSVSSFTTTVSRKSVSTRSYSVSRSSSSSSHAVARAATADSNPVCRPSSPCARVVTSGLGTSSAGSIVRPSTPSGRATTPSSKRPTSSSRSSSATRQSTLSVNQSHLPISLTRSSSTGKASLMSLKSASSHTSSPITRNRAMQLSGFSQEPPPNLRTSLPERCTICNTRGTSTESRPGGPSTARNTQAECTNVERRNRRPSGQESDAITDNRRHSRAPLVLRDHLSSDFQNGDKPGNSNDGVGLIPLSNTTVSKMVEKQNRSKPAAISAYKEPSVMMNTHVKRNMKSISTIQDTKSTSSSEQESAGSGKNLSKKSLDTALKHMNIRRSASNGFRSFMSNVPASSLFSVKSGRGRALSNANAVDSPMATSSNASSDHSMSIVPDLEGSDEAISEKGSKSSTASQPDSVSSVFKEKRISMWLDYTDSKDDDMEEMQIFKQGMEMLSGSESPLVSQHDGIAECDNFFLDMT